MIKRIIARGNGDEMTRVLKIRECMASLRRGAGHVRSLSPIRPAGQPRVTSTARHSKRRAGFFWIARQLIPAFVSFWRFTLAPRHSNRFFHGDEIPPFLLLKTA